MEREYVVLRGWSSGLPNRATRAGRDAGQDAGVAIDVVTLGSRAATDLQSQPEVHAIAPVVPMKLIAPMAATSDMEVDDNHIAWGVKAVGAHTSPFEGRGIVVAVLDTGIDLSHAAFVGVDILAEDFTGEGLADVDGHGTHCAGTIFGQPVDGVRIGVAPGIKQALIGKVIGRAGGSSGSILRAIQWAVDSGAHLVSLSVGIDFPGYVEDLVGRGMPVALATSFALEAYRANVRLFDGMAMLLRATEGVKNTTTLLVAAAGNESRRDAKVDFKIGVSPPAVADGVISVAALGRSRNGLSVATFSNSGATIAAPGVGIVSAKARGTLVAYSGTSMAAPHVVGIGALWAERTLRRGRLTAMELTSRIIASGRTKELLPPNDPVDVGAGLVYAPQE